MNLFDYLGAERGRAASLAATLRVPPELVSQWKTGERPVPAERCPDIERAADGEVCCEEMRADLAWARIPDKSWPWHKRGRPVLDVSKVAA